jgi:hypothetical protein
MYFIKFIVFNKKLIILNILNNFFKNFYLIFRDINFYLFI